MLMDEPSSSLLRSHERAGEGVKAFTALKVREWLAVAIFVVSITLLTLITHFKGQSEVDFSYDQSFAPQVRAIEVIVKGAVQFPGVYRLSNEMKVVEILALSEVSEEADMKKIRLESRLRKNRILSVPFKEMITVYITGAVKSGGSVKIEKGSTVSDALKMVELDEQADVDAIKRGKRMKENELIEVPFRKVL